MASNIHFESGYSEVNGLHMYYEMYGEGKPIVLVHGGGSTIETSFGRLIPLLCRRRQVIAVELQAHGHTNDRDTPLSFEQDANDVVTLLNNLAISKADFLGFSNGGQTVIEIAIRHPQIVNKIILASAFYKRDAVAPHFWDGFEGATIDMMPLVLKEGYLKANNSEVGLLNMFNRDVQRMKSFKGWTDEQLRSIKAPALVMNGSRDVCAPEHAVELYRAIPNCELVILPGGHGEYIGTIESITNGNWTQSYSVELIEQFLDKV